MKDGLTISPNLTPSRMQSKDKTAGYKSFTGQILNDFSSHNNFVDINIQLPQ
jgi:hypothetical protein